MPILSLQSNVTTMAKNKTEATSKSVHDFIAGLGSEGMRDDAQKLISIFHAITGFDAKMWGPSIIGFGTHHYKYESGHEGDMPLACFSPRKTAIVLYLSGFEKKEDLLKKLGNHKASKGCVYIKKLTDVDTEVLKKLVKASLKSVKKNYLS
jgi:hypothetical protein